MKMNNEMNDLTTKMKDTDTEDTQLRKSAAIYNVSNRINMLNNSNSNLKINSRVHFKEQSRSSHSNSI